LTRAEFLRSRAVLGHVHAHGVTHVPPGAAHGSDAPIPPHARGGHKVMTTCRAYAETVRPAHKVDRTGAAVPLVRSPW